MAETADRPIGAVWVTRAEPGAARTAERLTALGFQPVVAPLLAIRFLTPVLDMTGLAALAFTSVNGVAAFSSLSAERTLPVFAVGDATARAARGAGFTRVRSASGDLADLAALIRSTGLLGLILHPAAGEPAGDLAALAAGSAAIRSAAVYETIETPLFIPPAFDAVMVHSPRAGRALAKIVSGAGAESRLAIVISPAAAEPLAGLGLTQIRIADAPNETAMIAALGKPGASL